MLSLKLGVTQDSIIFGNGTDQIIEMVCDAILEKGKNIVIPHPTFLTYEKSAMKNGAEVLRVPFRLYFSLISSMVPPGTYSGRLAIQGFIFIFVIIWLF